MSNVATWVATLSDGSTVAENDFRVEPGLRKPWVQLTQKLGREKLYVTSLRLNLKGRTIHMPRLSLNGKFNYDEIYRAPLFYSMVYHLEGDMPFDRGPDDQSLVQTHYVELAAHYDDYIVRYIQDITNGNNSWVVVTDERREMAETPRRRD